MFGLRATKSPPRSAGGRAHPAERGGDTSASPVGRGHAHARPVAQFQLPGGHHLLVGPDSRVVLHDGPEIHGHRPSIDVTMQSVAQLYGGRARGVLLTGMGHDGALGLAAIRARGGRTYAQDAQSCVVNGMPQRAIERGAAECVAPPREIAHLLTLDLPAQRRLQAC